MSPMEMSGASPKPYIVISGTKARALIALGILQVLVGLGSIVTNGVGFQFYTPESVTGYTVPGIWAGLVFLCSGCTGIAAGVTKNVKTLVAAMTLATISCALALAQLGIAAVSYSLNYTVHTIRGNGDFLDWIHDESTYIAANITDLVLMACAIVEFLIALPSSGVVCNSFCNLQIAN